MSKILILIFAYPSEQSQIKERLGNNFVFIEELAEFIYLEEEANLKRGRYSHFNLEEYYRVLNAEETLICFSSNFSRSFWTGAFKKLKNSNFEKIHLYRASRLKEKIQGRGYGSASLLYLKMRRDFLLFCDSTYRLSSQFQSKETESGEKYLYFLLEESGNSRLSHLKQMSALSQIPFYFLQSQPQFPSLKLLYDHCKGLMLKMILELFHDHKHSRHTFKQGSLQRKRYHGQYSVKERPKNQSRFLWWSGWWN